MTAMGRLRQAAIGRQLPVTKSRNRPIATIRRSHQNRGTSGGEVTHGED